MSLPKAWVDSVGLSKNDEVEVQTGPRSVTITAGRGALPPRELTISYPLPAEENIVADLTGAYLLGYDAITVRGRRSIPAGDRENVRNSMRRLVGMEIVEEDMASIRVQFLLDETTLNPQRILRRISSIARGMFEDAIAALVEDDRSGLRTIANRDDEVNRQYFLLVRLIRSTMVGGRLAGAFNLENIDILDYRIAANLLEGAGDTVVELASLLYSSSVPRRHLERIHGIASGFGKMEEKTIGAFTGNDRKLAIEAIAMHRKFAEDLRAAKAPAGAGAPAPVEYLDLVHMFERVGRAWADIADLVKPIYSG